MILEIPLKAINNRVKDSFICSTKFSISTFLFMCLCAFIGVINPSFTKNSFLLVCLVVPFLALSFSLRVITKHYDSPWNPVGFIGNYVPSLIGRRGYESFEYLLHKIVTIFWCVYAYFFLAMPVFSVFGLLNALPLVQKM